MSPQAACATPALKSAPAATAQESKFRMCSILPFRLRLPGSMRLRAFSTVLLRTASKRNAIKRSPTAGPFSTDTSHWRRQEDCIFLIHKLTSPHYTICRSAPAKGKFDGSKGAALRKNRLVRAPDWIQRSRFARQKRQVVSVRGSETPNSDA